MATETAGEVKCCVCGKPIVGDDPDEFKCFGCGSYFHNDCEGADNAPFGKHDVDDHWENDEDDE